MYTQYICMSMYMYLRMYIRALQFGPMSSSLDWNVGENFSKRACDWIPMVYSLLCLIVYALGSGAFATHGRQDLLTLSHELPSILWILGP